jgi:hypothetical protein
MADSNWSSQPSVATTLESGNYTSTMFAKTLKKHRIRQSVGRTGICRYGSRYVKNHQPGSGHPLRGAYQTGQVIH